MPSKKAQSAMEYLMTYGWAILVVVAVVAALYGLGVFRTGSTTVKCSPCFTYFAYVDYANGVLKIRNGPSDISSLAVGSPAGATISPATASPGATVTVSAIPTSGAQSISINYTVTSSGLQHTDTATINQ